MRILRILFAVLGMMSFSPALAPALTVLPEDLDSLTADAELIFIGTVTSIRSEGGPTIRSERKPNTIYTYVTFSDLKVVKGTYQQGTMEVRLTGGTVAGETLAIPGMPKFVVGDKDLIFLAGNFRDFCPIVGWGQGRFRIRWDQALRKEVVFDDDNLPIKEIRGNAIVRVESAASLQQGSPGVPDSHVPQGPQLDTQDVDTRLSLDAFIAAIQVKMGILQHK